MPSTDDLKPSILLALVLALLVAGCGGGDETSTGAAGESSTAAGGASSDGADVSIDGGGAAIVWGEGSYGVVLAHGAAFDAASWSEQATQIADQGNVVIAVEDIAPESILAAAKYLEDERGAKAVALIGASAGADATLQALSGQPDAADQLITLSANAAVDGIGSEPKLFIASEGDPVAPASMELANGAEGDQNELLVLTGSAHAQNIFDGDQAAKALTAILDRLEQFKGS